MIASAVLGLSVLWGTPPAWAQTGKAKAWPVELYVVGVGSASSQEMARKAAMGDVARQLRARVTSEVEDRQWDIALGGKKQAGEWSRSSGRVSSTMDVPGVRVVETAQDGSVWWAMATLDRGQYVSAARMRIAEIRDESIKELAEAAKLAEAGEPELAVGKARAVERRVGQIVQLRAQVQTIEPLTENERLPFGSADFEPIYRAALEGLTLSKVDGDSQTAAPTGAWKQPLRVKILAKGKPVAGLDLVLLDGYGKERTMAVTSTEGIAELWPGVAAGNPPGWSRWSTRIRLSVPEALQRKLRALDQMFALQVSANQKSVSLGWEDLPGEYSLDPLVRLAVSSRLSAWGLNIQPGSKDSLVVNLEVEEKGSVQGLSAQMTRVAGTLSLRSARGKAEPCQASATGVGNGRSGAVRAALNQMIPPEGCLESLWPAVGAPNTPRSRIAIALMSTTELSGAWDHGNEVLAQMLATELVESGAFDVLERKQLDRVLHELELAGTGLTDGDLDKLEASGAQKLLLGGVVSVGGHLEADVRLVEIPSGKILQVASGSAESVSQLRTLAKQLVQRLVP